MDIARKLKSNTVCICRHEFWTDFYCKINSRSNFREYVYFQKNAITSGFSKNDKSFPWTWTGPFLYKMSCSQ